MTLRGLAGVGFAAILAAAVPAPTASPTRPVATIGHDGNESVVAFPSGQIPRRG